MRPISRVRTAYMSVLMIAVHNTVQNSSDNLSYPADNHHSRDGSGSPGHGSPSRRVNILCRVGSGHRSLSNTHYPVFWPGFSATKMYFLSTSALSPFSVFGSSGTGRLSTVSIHVLRRCLMSYCKASAMLYTHAVNGWNIARWDFDNIH